MLFYSTTVLLAATCLLLHAEAASQVMTSCENFSVHRLSCDIGVISVETVLYGRADQVTCSIGRPPDEVTNTDCSLTGAMDVVKKRCDGKTVCELSAKIFTASDPCKGTFKYLQTKYTCLPAIHHVTCEHSVAHLQCDEGLVISVYGADYGRRDQSTCSYARPDHQLQNTDCFHPTSVVGTSCNGKNSCSIKASNSVLEDPCYGTYKYLEVAYTCLYPDVPQEETST